MVDPHADTRCLIGEAELIMARYLDEGRYMEDLLAGEDIILHDHPFIRMGKQRLIY